MCDKEGQDVCSCLTLKAPVMTAADNIHKYFSIVFQNQFFKSSITLKCLSIGTPKIINFPFVSNGKLMIFRCPNIQTDYNEAVLCLNFGTPENNEFSIWDKWKIYYF